ncbi:hypothetical protein [Mycolicibacterium peregrinum]|uniref:Uncharacterized protein n=1 Tax=Mycolicibacterium peregrinum TaxID=43304 RepID=A0A1A0VZB8_MYCPR|nr:hypothetical protein [Mycolicibacterium peregrinum]OBB88660.1 hypothetical protein A5779_00115 [Mycolicibacterium peregrinum]
MMGQVAAFRLRLTQRQRELLRTYLWVHADDCYDDIEQRGLLRVEEGSLGSWSMFDRLPKAAWACPVTWRRQMARAFDDLALDLEADALPYPRCVAEEVALVLSVATAQSMWMDGQYSEEVSALPESAGDGDWASATDALVGNRHLTWHLSPGDAPVWMGDVPDPETWFDLFDGLEPRPARRGFRR